MAFPLRTTLAVALGLAALVATVLGFTSSWQTTHVSAGGFGTVDVERHLTYQKADAGSRGSQQEPYDAPQNDNSDSLRLTFQYQRITVWLATIASVLGVGALALPLFLRAAWVKPASLAALGALTVLSIVGASLFAYNITHTTEATSADPPETSFWGSNGPVSWAPGGAWYGEAAAGVLALAGLVVVALPAGLIPHARPAANGPLPPPEPLSGPRHARADATDPIEALKLRFARGEITLDEYQRARDELER